MLKKVENDRKNKFEKIFKTYSGVNGCSLNIHVIALPLWIYVDYHFKGSDNCTFNGFVNTAVCYIQKIDLMYKRDSLFFVICEMFIIS